MPAMGQPATAQSANTQPMAVVHPQSVITREREPPPQQAPAREPPPQAAENTQSTWVIEEVIDFGVPLDEGLVRECDDTGYPLGCKSLSIGASPRGNVNLFDGCVHNVCYDEQVMEMHGDRREGKDLC